jgi:hypothetical protein
MSDKAGRPKGPSMSRLLLAAVFERQGASEVSIAALVDKLGDRSFGWTLLLFAIINVLPWPPGATLITGIPLVLITGQMAFGNHAVWVPDFIGRRMVSRATFSRAILRLRPLFKLLEATTRRRGAWLFRPDTERLVGVALLIIAIVQFIPIPLSGWFPGFALLISSVGLIKRDGRTLGFGLILGVFSILLTAAVIAFAAAGFDRMFPHGLGL